MTEQTKWTAERAENGSYGFRSFPGAPFRITSKNESEQLVHAVNNYEELKSLLQNFISDHDTYKGVVPTYVIRFSLDASELLRRIEEGK